MTNLSPAIVLGAYMLCGTAAAAAPNPPAGSWHFTVLLDGRHIGEHDFTEVRRGDETVVDIAAHFKVKVAFIAVYAYHHRDHEVWRKGCLMQIDSRTDDNGKTFVVHGILKGDRFDLHDARDTVRLPECVSTFAYWDPRLLAQQRLLNSQTGEYQPVTVTEEGIENLKVRGQMIAAQRYSLRAPKLDINLWYSAAGEWVALESKLRAGRILRYEIQ